MPVTFAHQSSPFDTVGHCPGSSSYYAVLGGSAWSPTLHLWAVAGGSCNSTTAIATSAGSGTWTSRGNPWNAGLQGYGNDVVWAPALGKFIAVGGGQTAGTARSATSSDGITWTPGTAIPGEIALGRVFWNDSLGQAIAIGAFGGTYYRSSDGLTWTAIAGIPAGLSVSGFAAHGTTWVAVGFVTSGSVSAATSTDGIAWTGRHTPFDAGGSAELDDVIWSPTLSEFVAIGMGGAGGAQGCTSPDGITWTGFSGAPWIAAPDEILDLGGYLAIVGTISGGKWLSFTGDLIHYEIDSSPVDTGGFFFFRPLGYSSTLNQLLFDAVAPAGVGGPGIYVGTPSSPPIPPPPVETRFFEGYPWRFIFTDIPAAGAPIPTFGGTTTTWAQGILTNRQITKTLNQPATIEAAVFPDDRRANDIWTDGDPVIAQGNRLVYCFRREGGSPPWKCRAAGILMSPEDQGGPDVPLTHFVAYDPWQYLAGRIVVDADGNPPATSYGRNFTGQTGAQIALTVLKDSIAADGFAFIDAGVAWGGTSHYGGTIEATDELVFNVQEGTTVADVWTQLCDTGTLDIVLKPIYDPLNRPGYTHELSIYRLAGNDLPGVVFGWDTLNRSLTNIDRQHSGVPADFANKILYYVGQGGPPAPVAINGLSVSKYGAYWSTQFFPIATIPTGETPEFLAKQALFLSKQGARTLTVDPTPERSPNPLVEYDIGDRVAIWATKRLRVAATDTFATQPPSAQRVQTIPIVIDDDGVERVQALVTSPDWRTLPPVTPPTPTTPAGGSGQTSSAAILAAGMRSTRRRAMHKLGTRRFGT